MKNTAIIKQKNQRNISTSKPLEHSASVDLGFYTRFNQGIIKMKKWFLVAFLTASNTIAANMPITGTAKEAKFSSCLSAVAYLEKFFGEGNNYGSWSQWAKEGADKQPFNSSIEITFKDGSQLIDMTVTPAPDGTCSFHYSRTWFSEQSCMATTKEPFMKNAEFKADLNKNIAAFDKDGAQILLMPAGNGCLVQKKENDFRYSKQTK